MTTTTTSTTITTTAVKPRGFRLVRTVDGVEIPAAGLWNIPSNWASIELSAHRRFRRPFRAKLTLQEGTITIGDNPNESTATIRLNARSVLSGNPRRDQILRDQLLDATRYPTIGLRIAAIQHVSGPNWKAHGWITVRDIATPIDFAVHYAGVYGRGTAAQFHVQTSVPLHKLIDADSRLLSRAISGRELRVTADIHAHPVWLAL